MANVTGAQPTLPGIVVAAGWLASNLAAVERGMVVVCDVRWYLDGRDARAAYRAGHIPGARFVDLDSVGSDHSGAVTEGRHPLPAPARFAADLAALGIGADSVVVAYDDSGGGTACRLVWMLRAQGVGAALLDGGIGAWPGELVAGNEPHADSEPRGDEPDGDGPHGHEPHGDAPRAGIEAAGDRAPVEPRAWPADLLATWGDVESVETGRSPRRVLLDARAGDRYRGETEPVDPRAGHIPGAVNLPWASVLDPATRRMRSAAELEAVFASVGVGRDDDVEVIASCGSGVSACALLVALEHAGRPPAKLFVPSWSGWSSDPGRPAATGPRP